MELDNAQRAKITEWISQGMKLSEIQNRLTSEFNLKLTYMEVRLLVDDLKLTPKDPEPPAKPATPAPAPAAGTPNQAADNSEVPFPEAEVPGAPPAGGVSVYVDQVTRPGSLASGKVTFSDGMKAEWYLDQSGRLGLSAQKPGYRPTPGDVQQFQAALQEEFAKMGY